MELRQLRYFLKAKELLNFTEAAHALHISQSTLSQQIKQLEDELNVLLFDRVGKRVILTEGGLLFTAYAQQSVNKAKEGKQLLQDLNNLQTGTISIGVTYALRNLLTRTLINFSDQFPAIQVNITFGTSDELLEKLNEFTLDFVLTFSEVNASLHLNHQILFQSPMTLVAAIDTPIAVKKNITLQELKELPLALAASGYSTIRFMKDIFKKSGLVPNVSVEINDIPTLLDLVKTGKWYTILTKTSVNEAELRTIPIKGNNMMRTAMIISHKEGYEKKAVTRFYETLRNVNNLI